MARKYELEKISVRIHVKDLRKIDKLVEIEETNGREDNANRTYIIRKALKIGLNELNSSEPEAAPA